MKPNTTLRSYRSDLWRNALPIAAMLLAQAGHAQTIFLETFDGGASTTGFTVDQTNTTDCRWEYAPDSAGAFDFSIDFGGFWPAGPGFDSSFVFLDSDACGGTGVVVDSYLYSALFDASATGSYTLAFSQQFRARLASFASVQVSPDGGSTWTEVLNETTDNVGYPNPAVVTTIDITAAAAGSAAAQLRFEFSAGWDWWWALDSISVSHAGCAFPTNLAVSNVTTSGATFAWDDIGSAGYEWVVTTGPVPDGSNGVATGDGSNLTASGLTEATTYYVYVRSLCNGGGNSAWSSGVPFTTAITNDECVGASLVNVNIDAVCDSTTHGTVIGATASGVTSTCTGTADDDVWFTFTANAAVHHISLINLTGSTQDMFFAVWSGPCASLVLVPNSCSDPQDAEIGGLVAGQTYDLQVYTWTSTTGQTSQFDVCIGPSNTIGIQEREEASALRLFPNPTNGILALDYAGTGAVSMRVYDVLGQVLSQRPMTSSIDVASLSKGTYMLALIDREGRIIARRPFVKE